MIDYKGKKVCGRRQIKKSSTKAAFKSDHLF